MALSLLAGYCSDGSDSSDSDDGINVIIHKHPQPKRTNSNGGSSSDRPDRAGRAKRTAVAAGLPAGGQNTSQKTRQKLPMVGGRNAPPVAPPSVLDAGRHPELDDDPCGQMVGLGGGAVIPLPSTVLTMFDKTAEQEALDQAALHGGRVRSFKHEANNWASYVYIDMSDLDELDEVRNFLLGQLELEPTEDTHISLSRTVSLRHHWIDPVVQGVSHGFKQVDRFTVKLDKLQVYCNDERTRTFVGLQATGGCQQLAKLSKVVDGVLRDFSLPPFYYPPSFHVSLGWCLGDKTKEISPILPALELKLLDVIEDVDDFGKLFIKMAHCKCGNRFFDFKLR